MTMEPTGYYGPYRGVCTNVTDPEGLGRIKAVVPQLFGDASTETDWALACSPAGYTAAPIPGQGVWVSFEGGDLNYPVYIGMWQSEPALTPYDPAGAANQALIASEAYTNQQIAGIAGLTLASLSGTLAAPYTTTAAVTTFMTTGILGVGTWLLTVKALCNLGVAGASQAVVDIATVAGTATCTFAGPTSGEIRNDAASSVNNAVVGEICYTTVVTVTSPGTVAFQAIAVGANKPVIAIASPSDGVSPFVNSTGWTAVQLSPTAAATAPSGLALPTVAGNLTVAYTVTNVQTTFLTTPVLQVGTWLITFNSYVFQGVAGISTDLFAVVGTGTATLNGTTSASTGITGQTANAAISMSFIANVTVAGTINFQAINNGTTDTAVEIASSISHTGQSTGFTATLLTPSAAVAPPSAGPAVRQYVNSSWVTGSSAGFTTSALAPPISVTIGASGDALVFVGGYLDQAAGNQEMTAGFQIDGIATPYYILTNYNGSTRAIIQMGNQVLVSEIAGHTLTPGVHTFQIGTSLAIGSSPGTFAFTTLMVTPI